MTIIFKPWSKKVALHLLFIAYVISSVLVETFVSQGQTTVPVAPSEIDTSEWLIYLDETLGFSVKYPPDWTLHPSSEDDSSTNNASITNYDIKIPAEEGRFQSGLAKVSFSVSENQLNDVSDKLEYIQSNYLHPESEISTVEVSKRSQLEQIRFDFTLFDESWTYIYIPQDFVLLFVSAVYTDEETAAIIEAILATLSVGDINGEGP